MIFCLEEPVSRDGQLFFLEKKGNAGLLEVGDRSIYRYGFIEDESCDDVTDMPRWISRSESDSLHNICCWYLAQISSRKRCRSYIKAKTIANRVRSHDWHVEEIDELFWSWSPVQINSLDSWPDDIRRSDLVFICTEKSQFETIRSFYIDILDKESVFPRLYPPRPLIEWMSRHSAIVGYFKPADDGNRQGFEILSSKKIDLSPLKLVISPSKVISSTPDVERVWS